MWVGVQNKYCLFVCVRSQVVVAAGSRCESRFGGGAEAYPGTVIWADGGRSDGGAGEATTVRELNQFFVRLFVHGNPRFPSCKGIHHCFFLAGCGNALFDVWRCLALSVAHVASI